MPLRPKLQFAFWSMAHEPVRNGEVGDWRLPDDDFLASFRLPVRGAGKLARLHPFYREDLIHFDRTTLGDGLTPSIRLRIQCFGCAGSHAKLARMGK